MRPVSKWEPGNVKMRDGSLLIVNTNYPDYKDAKPVLSRNLGCFCSYCEKSYIDDDRDLQVEHIQPKNYKKEGGKIYAHLETAWDNFLLSCATCNGMDNKDSKDVVYGKCHLPHLNNTFLSLKYMAGGVVKTNPTLTGKSQENATNLLKLVGLDKGPSDSSPKDVRWKIRSNRWNLATRYLNKFNHGTASLETIVDLARSYGCWSIWFTVFHEHDEVKKALIEKFPGTAAECFDPNNHYEPVNRNPLNEEDPI